LSNISPNSIKGDTDLLNVGIPRTHDSTHIVTIIVTYHADISIIDHIVETIYPQVSGLVVVDNGSAIEVVNWLSANTNKGFDFIALGENKGIAFAQNVGIEWAEKNGANHILFLDHDSIPEKDMVSKLLDATISMTSKDISVAAVGPRYYDVRHNNPPPFIRIRKFGIKRCQCNHEHEVVPVDYLISSGCLIPMKVIKKVGIMREEFFIDYVDIEWGLRARSLGFQSFGVCDARMHHELGEEPIRFLGLTFPIHSPLRHYYLFRNAVWMYQQPTYNVHWKFVDAYRLLIKYIFYSLFATPRYKHFYMMSLGIWHGLCGRQKSLEEYLNISRERTKK